MLSINSVRTLAEVVIIDPTRVDLVSWVTLYHAVMTTIVAEAKDGIYLDCFPTDMSFPLVVEVIGCLHQQMNKFFINH